MIRILFVLLLISCSSSPHHTRQISAGELERLHPNIVLKSKQKDFSIYQIFNAKVIDHYSKIPLLVTKNDYKKVSIKDRENRAPGDYYQTQINNKELGVQCKHEFFVNVKHPKKKTGDEFLDNVLFSSSYVECKKDNVSFMSKTATCYYSKNKKFQNQDLWSNQADSNFVLIKNDPKGDPKKKVYLVMDFSCHYLAN